MRPANADAQDLGQPHDLEFHWFAKMTTISSEPRPGTAFKKIVEEQAMMDEFVAMIGKKMEADKRHLDDLIDLKEMWNPKWSETGVWELMSPILAYFTEEISHRTAAQEDIMARFTSVQTRDEPVSLFYACEDRMEPLLGIGEALEKAYVVCEGCRRSTNTPEAQQTIAQATTAIEEIMEKSESHEVLRILLPVEDRAYRIAVNTQHQAMPPVEGWYANELPGIVERHQQRAEDIKTFLLGCCGSLGKLASDLSASCSSALHSNQAFASTRFIAPRHDEIEREKFHLLLRKYEYRNFFDGRIVEPIFGLGPRQTLTLANQILDAIETGILSILSSRGIRWISDLEERVLTNTDLAVGIRGRSLRDLNLLLKVALWSDDPLFPISPEYFGQDTRRVPRKKLRQVVESIKPEFRNEVMSLLMRLWRETYSRFIPDFANQRVASLLCHTTDAEFIISEIHRKWDFDGDCPLPDGVTRCSNPSGVRFGQRLARFTVFSVAGT